jgi:hypothetical protein
MHEFMYAYNFGTAYIVLNWRVSGLKSAFLGISFGAIQRTTTEHNFHDDVFGRLL